MEPKGAPRQPKGAKKVPFWTSFSHTFRYFVTQAPDGSGRWPQGATTPHNEPQMLQKVTPTASKTSTNEPPEVSSLYFCKPGKLKVWGRQKPLHLLRTIVGSNKGATKWPQALQTERALKQRTHTPLRLSQTSPRTSAMHVMQVLLGCFPIEPKRKELKSPEHNTEATATHQDPRCGGGAQAFSIKSCGP